MHGKTLQSQAVVPDASEEQQKAKGTAWVEATSSQGAGSGEGVAGNTAPPAAPKEVSFEDMLAERKRLTEADCKSGSPKRGREGQVPATPVDEDDPAL